MNEAPVALVTGTSRGLGLSIAQYLLEQGYIVAGCSRGDSPLESDNYEHSSIDVSEDSDVSKWINGVGRSHRRIDIVVNNAGLLPSAALAMATPQKVVEAAIRTNFLATFSVCREASKIMRQRRFGRIINISTIANALHLEGASAYAASKSAMVEFSKVLAKELAPVGITVNVIAVSFLETDMTAELSQETKERYLNNLTIKRYATTDDVCNVVSFFSGAASGYITGQIVNLGFVD